MPIHLERRYRFSSSHLYRRPDWSEEENRRRFGKCSNLPGHGHNYRLFVTLAGEPDPETGFLVDLGALDGLVADEVVEPLDHHHLNEAVEEFGPGGSIPSSENLVEWIARRLVDRIPGGARLAKLRLEEDEDLAAEWWPASE